MATTYSEPASKPSKVWRVEIFYDADCPLCVKEIAVLRWLDRRNRVRFTNIAADTFQPTEYGKTMKQFMDEIQGRLPDGQWIVGVEVFRQVYSAIGLGVFVWPTRLPLIRNMLDWGYHLFARNRLRWTGRCKEQSCGLAPQTELIDEKITE